MFYGKRIKALDKRINDVGSTAGQYGSRLSQVESGLAKLREDFKLLTDYLKVRREVTSAVTRFAPVKNKK